MSTNDSDIKNYDTNPASNTRTPPLGAPENNAPSTVNDIIREKMADAKIQWLDAQWFNQGHDVSRVSATTFRVSSDQTSEYLTDRRLKLFDSSTLYATVLSSSFTTQTTITVDLDSGSLTASLTGVGLAILTKQNSSIPEEIVTTDNIADGAITTDNISNNAVTLGKMATGTQGGIIYFNSAGEATELTAGTSGQYLQTLGPGAAPQWAAVQGDMALLATATPSNTSNVTFTEVTSTFTNYEIHYSNMVPTLLGRDVMIRNLVGGSVNASTVYNHSAVGRDSKGSQITRAAENTTSYSLGTIGGNSVGTLGTSGIVKLYNVPVANRTMITFRSTWDTHSNSAAMVFFNGGGEFISAVAVSGFRVTFAAGNISSGTIKLYGYR